MLENLEEKSRGDYMTTIKIADNRISRYEEKLRKLETKVIKMRNRILAMKEREVRRSR